MPAMRLCRCLCFVALVLAGCATVAPPPVPPESDLDRITASYRSPTDAPAVLEAWEQKMAERQLAPSELPVSNLATYSQLLLAAGRLSDAEKSLDSLNQRKPGDRTVMLSLALLAGARGDTSAQEARVKELEKAFPGDTDAADLRARLLLAKGDRAGAQAAWSAILKKREDPKALIALATLARQDKHPEEALPLADRAVKASADDQALSLRGQILADLGRYAAARRDFDQAIALSPEDPWLYFERGRLAWLHLYEPALARFDLEFAAIKTPENLLAWATLAQVDEELLKPRQAYDAWLKALSLRPDYRPAYPSVAMLAFRYQDFDRAAAYARKASTDYPAEYGFPFVEALSLKALGQPQLAQSVLEKARPRFEKGSSVDEMFRFLLVPGSDYFLNTALGLEKQEVVRERLRFYQGCYYALTKSPGSARAAFDEVGSSTLTKIPEIAAARDWMDHGL